MTKTINSARHRRLVELLVEYRRTAGLTQTELAARLGQHQSFVARLESGERRIDIVELLELAEAVGFDAAALVRQLSDSNPKA